MGSHIGRESPWRKHIASACKSLPPVVSTRPHVCKPPHPPRRQARS